MPYQDNVVQEINFDGVRRIIANFKKDSSARHNGPYFEIRLEKLRQAWTKCEDNHVSTHALLASSSQLLKDYLAKYEELENDVFEYLSIFKKGISDNADVKRTPMGGSVANSDSIRLERIKIPTFSGKYTEWCAFRELYESMVHTNAQLTGVQRLQYLRNSIKGEAERIINHLPMKDENYDTAWKLLCERYDNNRAIAHDMMQQFWEIQPCSKNDVIGMKRIVETTNQFLASTQALEINAFDLVTVFMLTQKLDDESRREWHNKIGSCKNVPTLNEFMAFCTERFSILEAVQYSNVQPKHKRSSNAYTVQYSDKPSCVVCKADHRLVECKRFKEMTVQSRRTFIKENKLCFNCMGKNHLVSNCRSQRGCGTCGKRHHTMLHNTESNTESQSNHVQGKSTQGLLATAKIRVKNVFGQFLTLRALVDQGSQNSLITEEAARLLGLKRQKSVTIVKGIGDKANTSRGQIPLIIQEKWTSNEIATDALIMGKITNELPSASFKPISSIQVCTEDLADPEYHVRGKIDIILGAEVFGDIMLRQVKRGYPTAVKTTIGWILFGRTLDPNRDQQVVSMISTNDLDQSIQRFWAQEDISNDTILTPEEQEAEIHYAKTVKRLENGRFQVNLPWKGDPITKLAPSRVTAIKRFDALERRLLSNKTLQGQYNACLQEYLDSGHMEEVPLADLNKPSFYLPHHAVLKESSTSTKVRVVFNASAKTQSESSLNDLLMVGPTIQDTLATLLTRWRTHSIVLSADIEKMYRQIMVHPKDWDFQRIIWRRKDSETVKHFRLKTVTFGTASAPFQAIRTLREIALREKEHFPISSQCLFNDFYVDDLLTGTDSEEDATKLYKELVLVLAKYGFPIRKWKTNSRAVLEQVPTSERDDNGSIKMNLEEGTRILGIEWHSNKDVFRFKIHNTLNPNVKLTKRTVASHIATLYDPLGWVQPVIIRSKIFLQKLWLAKLDWDEELPKSLQEEWLTYINDMANVEEITIPRWIGTFAATSIELHGFCDASNAAIAAVVYVRVISEERSPMVNIIAAKTKVTPLAVQTIPRLELSGALLLTKLMDQTKLAFKNLSISGVHYWTDSSVVLSWLSEHPAKWNTYVGNRVSQIHALSNANQWHHISTKQNPADCASRGIHASELLADKLWWNGPQIINQVNAVYQPIPPQFTELERRKVVHSCISKTEECILNQFSNFTRMIRVIAYCRRFGRHRHQSIHLSANELTEAKMVCIQIAQMQMFSDEIEKLKNEKPLSVKSKLIQLNPYIDVEGTLRVGGRLRHADLTMSEMHPIILDTNSQISEMIIRDVHQKTLHGSAQLTLSTLRQEYWILRAQSLVKKCIHQCIVCFKHNAHTKKQLMGAYPVERVRLNRPFWSTGLDFAGPITVKWSNGRGAKTMKAYIAVFICLATKAIHLELVGDLTSASCIAAIKRFIARRGKCKNIYSDCGTNFVAAGKELQQIFEKMTNDAESFLANDNIVWHHIPPSSPHFGGLWEAGVKSVKRHLSKTFGDSLLNVEEMYTALAQIEACLNSRPLAPMSDDVNDLTALTPGHFLVGDTMIAVPDEVNDNLKVHKRWELTEKLAQEFWKRWHMEYITRLQERPKWLSPQSNVQKGQLVLVKHELMPSTKWPLARIVDVHPGDDGLVRVATIKLNNRITKRPVAKLSPLPINDANIECDLADIKKKQEREKVEEPNPFKRRRVITSHASTVTWPLWTCIVVCAIFIPMTQATVNTTSILSGLYVEHLGDIVMNRGSLKINIQTSYLELSSDLANVSSLTEAMISLCKLGKLRSPDMQCEESNGHLNTQERDITHYIKAIEFTKSRMRRGILGTVLTSVFGVNDEVYQDIDRLSENQNNLRNMVNHHGTIMLKVSRALNSTNERISKQLDQFNQKLEDCTIRIKDLGRWDSEIDHSKVQIYFMTALQHAVMYLDEVRRKYECLWTLIHGRMDMWSCALVTEIISIVNKAESSLPPTLRIHMSSNKPLIEYEENFIIISGLVPIYHVKQYEIIVPTVVPQTVQNDVFLFYDIPQQIFGINYDSQEYLVLSEKIFADRLEIGNKLYMIQIQIVYNMATRPNCIFYEIYNSYNIQKCPIQQMKIDKTIWKRVYNPNTYLFAAPTSTLAHAICNGKRTELILRGSGIIKLTPECSVATHEVTLLAEQRIISEEVITYTKIGKMETNLTLPSKLKPRLISESRLLQPHESFTTLLEDEMDLQDERDDFWWRNVHHHAIAASISSVGILAILGIIVTICICKRKKSFRISEWHHPIPPPSSTASDPEEKNVGSWWAVCWRKKVT